VKGNQELILQIFKKGFADLEKKCKEKKLEKNYANIDKVSQYLKEIRNKARQKIKGISKE